MALTGHENIRDLGITELDAMGGQIMKAIRRGDADTDVWKARWIAIQKEIRRQIYGDKP